MGDRVAVLKDGLLQQVDTPRNMYDRPGQPLRRRLHRLPGDEPRRGPDHRRRREVRQLAWSRSTRDALQAAADKGDRTVTVGVRPEHFDIVEHGDAAPRCPRTTPAGLAVTVNVVEELGADGYVYGTAEVGGETKDLVVRVGGRAVPEKGAVLHVVPRAGRDPRVLDLDRRAPED